MLHSVPRVIARPLTGPLPLGCARGFIFGAPLSIAMWVAILYGVFWMIS